jgi:hypothetical protein
MKTNSAPLTSRLARKAICIIAFSPIAHDARVLRQIKYLSSYYDLTVIGFGEPHPDWQHIPSLAWKPLHLPVLSRTEKASILTRLLRENKRHLLFVELIRLPLIPLILPTIYNRWYWSDPRYAEAFALAMGSDCDTFYANDWNSLPVAVEAARKKQGRVVFDAHEYAPLEYEHDLRWRKTVSPAIRHMLKKCIPHVDASITIAPTIADKYREEFNLNPLVVLNTPDIADLKPHEIDPRNIRLIHHGGSMRIRRLETMIETVALCDKRYSLHFMLVGDDTEYIEFLRRLGDKLAPGRVIFHNPVSPEKLVEKLSEFDMGIFLLEPNNFNYTYALPNKFFDFVVARLAVCIGPSPEMSRFVHRYGVGCVAPTFRPQDVALMLNSLHVNQIEEMRKASREAAKELNAEKEMGKVIKLLAEL